MEPQKTQGRVTHATKASVFAACDALVAAGAKPTVESIRRHLGGGSPNTVGPLLHGWFQALGSRMDGAAPAPTSTTLPPTALDAAETMWAMALSQARETVENELAGRRAEIGRQELQLVVARDDLAQERAIHDQQVRSAQLAMEEISRSREEAVSRAALGEESRVQAEERAASLQEDVAALHGRLADKERIHAGMVEVHAAAQAAWDDERRQISAAAAAEHRRLMLEVDTARTAGKNAAAAAQGSITRLEHAVATAKQEAGRARDELADSRAEVTALNAQLLVARAERGEQPHALTLGAAARRARQLRARRSASMAGAARMSR